MPPNSLSWWLDTLTRRSATVSASTPPPLHLDVVFSLAYHGGAFSGSQSQQSSGASSVIREAAAATAAAATAAVAAAASSSPAAPAASGTLASATAASAHPARPVKPPRPVRTIEDEVMKATRGLMGDNSINMVALSRTDAEVCARDALCWMRLPIASLLRGDLGPDRLRDALHASLPPDIRVPRLRFARPSQIKLKSASSAKRYAYYLGCGDYLPLSHLMPHVVFVGAALDLDAMRTAALHIVGRHDFTPFSKLSEASPAAQLENAKRGRCDKPLLEGVAGTGGAGCPPPPPKRRAVGGGSPDEERAAVAVGAPSEGGGEGDSGDDFEEGDEGGDGCFVDSAEVAASSSSSAPSGTVAPQRAGRTDSEKNTRTVHSVLIKVLRPNEVSFALLPADGGGGGGGGSSSSGIGGAGASAVEGKSDRAEAAAEPVSSSSASATTPTELPVVALPPPRPLTVDASVSPSSPMVRGRGEAAGVTGGPLPPVTSGATGRAVRPAPYIIRITFEGDGFLRGMVRKLVGALINIGKGRAPGSFIEDALRPAPLPPLRSEEPPHGTGGASTATETAGSVVGGGGDASGGVASAAAAAVATAQRRALALKFSQPAPGRGLWLDATIVPAALWTDADYSNNGTATYRGDWMLPPLPLPAPPQALGGAETTAPLE